MLVLNNIKISLFFIVICMKFNFGCKLVKLCNSSDPSTECGLIQLLAQQSNPLALPSESNSDAATNVTSVSSRCTSCRIFVTNSTYNANLAGIVGADMKCSTDSNKPETGTYKALIVDEVNRRACSSTNCSINGNTEHLDWVFYKNTNYVQASNTANSIFITDGNATFSGTLTNVLFTATTSIWTGLKNNPSWDWQTNTTLTCSSWTDSTSVNCGTYGVTSWTDSRAFAITSSYGNGSSFYNLLCVEQ
jgi:hypothetical protein